MKKKTIIILLIIIIISILLEFFIPIMILTEEGHKLNGRIDFEWFNPDKAYKVYLFGRVKYINNAKDFGETHRISIIEVIKLVKLKIDSKTNLEIIATLKTFINN